MFQQTRRGTTQQKRQAGQPERPAPQGSARVAQPMWGATPALNLEPIQRSLGADFSDVRIHPDSAQAARVGALAYTQGEEIHFAPGQFNPDSSRGRHLLGHELAHVVQQRQGRVQPSTQVAGLPVNDDPRLEAEADTMGARAAHAPLQTATEPAEAQPIQRKAAGSVAQFAPPQEWFDGVDQETLEEKPANWDKRPEWLGDKKNGAFRMRQIIAARMTPVSEVDDEPLYSCGATGKPGPLDGMDVDHIRDWAAYAREQGTDNQYDLEYWYNDLNNLHLVLSGPNSSKQQTDLLQWWQKENAEKYFQGKTRRVLRGLRWGATRFNQLGISRVSKIPAKSRKPVLGTLLKHAMTKNGLEKIMTASKLYSLLKVSPTAGLPGMDEEEKDESMSQE